MSILEIIGLIWLCMLAFNFFSMLSTARREGQLLDRTVKNTIENKVREIYVDVINDRDGQSMFLVYDAKTNDFLGQGNSHDEIIQTLKTRFPDKIFAISNENLSKIAS